MQEKQAKGGHHGLLVGLSRTRVEALRQHRLLGSVFAQDSYISLLILLVRRNDPPGTLGSRRKHKSTIHYKTSFFVLSLNLLLYICDAYIAFCFCLLLDFVIIP